MEVNRAKYHGTASTYDGTLFNKRVKINPLTSNEFSKVFPDCESSDEFIVLKDDGNSKKPESRLLNLVPVKSIITGAASKWFDLVNDKNSRYIGL